MKKTFFIIPFCMVSTLAIIGCSGGEGSSDTNTPTSPEQSKEEQPSRQGYAPASLAEYYLIETQSIIRPTRNMHYRFYSNGSCEFLEKSNGPESSIFDDVLLSDKEGTYEATGQYAYTKTGLNKAELSISVSGTWTSRENGTVPYTREVTMKLIFNDAQSILVNDENLNSNAGTKNGRRTVYFHLSKTPK